MDTAQAVARLPSVKKQSQETQLRKVHTLFLDNKKPGHFLNGLAWFFNIIFLYKRRLNSLSAGHHVLAFV